MDPSPYTAEIEHRETLVNSHLFFGLINIVLFVKLVIWSVEFFHLKSTEVHFDENEVLTALSQTQMVQTPLCLSLYRLRRFQIAFC